MAITPPTTEQNTAHSHENQLRFVINVASRHWRKILAFTIVGMLLLVLIGRLRPEQLYPHASEGVVRIEPSPLSRIKGIGAVRVPTLTAKDLVARTNERDLAEAVARAIVQHDIANNGPWSNVSTFEELQVKTAELIAAINLIAVSDDSGERIQIQASADDLGKATRYADFATRVFVAQNREAQLEEGRELHQAVADSLTTLRVKLDEAENKEWQYRKEMGFLTNEQVGDKMRMLDEELSMSQATREETSRKMLEMRGNLELKNQQLPESMGQVTDAVVEKLIIELGDLVQKQLSLGVERKSEHPEMQMVAEEINDKKTAIMNAINRIDSGVGGGGSVWDERKNLLIQYNKLLLNRTATDIRIATLERILNDMVENLPELVEQNSIYKRYALETQQLRKQFDALLDQEIELRMMELNSSAYTKLERVQSDYAAPIMAGRKKARTLALDIALGGFVGFLLGFGLAIMLEMMDTSIRSAEDVMEYVNLEVIGTIPMMRFGKPKGRKRGRRRGTYVSLDDESQIDACIVTQHDPKSPVSEAYRSLRTNFQLATIHEKAKTIMVTSAVPGEGKTTTAVNLAVTMADSGMKVLLIDTDLRRPNVHRVLKMERGPGLADVLREQIDVNSVIRSTRIENLSVVSSGRVPPNPSELIGSERMQGLMKYFSDQFDIVICDAPSTLVVTDPVLMSTHIQSVLIVVSVNNARRDTVIRAKTHLNAAQAKIVGVVLNGLEASRRHYYYYYYYYDDGNTGRNRWYHLQS